MNDSIIADLFAALDIVVLQRREDNFFRVIGTIPDWFLRLYPDASSRPDELRPEEKLPFLENYLVDAQDFWREKREGWLRSGVWTETDPSGTESQHEAIAVCVGNRQMLLLEVLSAAYEERRSLLQKARESSLLYQRLVQTERALRESEEKFSVIFHKSLDVIMIIDGESGRILRINPAVHRILGYEQDALIGKPFSLFLLTSERPADDLLDRLRVQGAIFATQELRRADGSICPADLTATLIPWDQGQAILATFRDVTERRRAEARLEETLVQLRKSRDDMISILNQLRLGTAMTDRDGRVTFLSEVCQRFLGKRPGEVLGRHWEQVFPVQEQDKVQLRTMAEHAPQHRTKVLVRARPGQGRRYWLEIDVQDDPHDPQRKIFFFYDVSEVHDLRRLLEEKTHFHDLIGKSKPMQLVYQQIREVARVDSIVLVEGETGTGKELVAQAIHYTSHRKDKPFIAVNCAGLTESLVASQLFGHKRGAFTGAVTDHQGLFEAANGGTLFLDEIGDIPMSVQTSLLRVLQEHEITRLGESKPRKIDVRVLAATHRNLSEEVEKGDFRMDLLYRIRVARIQLPPLRERREDIPPLVEFFLSQCRASIGKSVHEVCHEAMRVLVGYAWPGNVRELKSAIEFAVIRCKGSAIQVMDLPPELIDTIHPYLPPSGDAYQDEAQRLLAALKQAKGNRTAAARLLGISRATLYRRLASLDMRPGK